MVNSPEGDSQDDDSCDVHSECPPDREMALPLPAKQDQPSMDAYGQAMARHLANVCDVG